MPDILIVDDEAEIVRLIKRYAEREGYRTAQASNGAEAVEICSREDFDLVIMDVMMPEMDGFKACKEIRRKKDIPVLMLSARGTEYDKLFGFEVGVDDYLTKPFSPKELMARVNVIIKRHRHDIPEKKKDFILRAGGLEIDTLGRNVFVDGKKTELTAKEYDLLVFLVTNEGIVLTRDRILNGVWGYDYYGDDRTVDWQIKLLRGKIGTYRDRIHTVRGVGYKFER
ncbi:MAG: response regulator transcription factor [Porcipelethomonas sp.]